MQKWAEKRLDSMLLKVIFVLRRHREWNLGRLNNDILWHLHQRSMIRSRRVGHSEYPTRLLLLKWLVKSLVFHLEPPFWLLMSAVKICWFLCLWKNRRLYNDRYYQETFSRVDKLHKHNRWKSEAEVRESVDFKQGELKGT